VDAVRNEIIKLTGLNIDIPPAELISVPTWTGGNNIRFDDGSTHRTDGYARYADPLPVGAFPIFIHPVLTPTTSYWIVVSKNETLPVWKIYVTDGSTYWDITPVAGITGGEAGFWCGTDLNGVPVLNNGVDSPIWWNGDTGAPMTTLPDWPVDTTCKSIRAYKYHLVAMNITDAGGDAIPHRIMWSSAADPKTIPQSWTPEPGNDAGNNDLADNLGGIVDGGNLRDSFIVYFQHASILMQYVAGQYVFTFRGLFETLGIQAINCWTEIKGTHIILADDDVIRHDGQKFESIADARIRNYLFSGITPDNHTLCCVVGRTEIDEVMICVPVINYDYLTVALLYNYRDDVWGVRTLPDVAYVTNGIVPQGAFDGTWDGAIPIWQLDPRWWNEANYSITSDNILMCDPAGQRLLEVDASPEEDGEPLSSFVERLSWSIHDESEVWENKLIQSIYPHITGTVGDTVTCRVGVQVSMGDPVDWGPRIPFTIGGRPKVDNLKHGRFLSLRFESEGGESWNIHRIGIEYVPLSKY